MRKTIIITSGPTREYLDPVRYLTNASSGRMGAALAKAALALGYWVQVISGPVEITYPTGAEVFPVITTEEMLKCARRLYPDAVGIIGAAAPCDFRPRLPRRRKITKECLTDEGLTLELVQTPDILVALGKIKRPDQWLIAFALETHNCYRRAKAKLRLKNADFVALNHPEVIGSDITDLEILDGTGPIERFQGSKDEVSRRLVEMITEVWKEKNKPKKQK